MSGVLIKSSSKGLTIRRKNNILTFVAPESGITQETARSRHHDKKNKEKAKETYTGSEFRAAQAGMEEDKDVWSQE